MQGATASLTAVKETSVDPAVAAVLSEPDDIFALKGRPKPGVKGKYVFAVPLSSCSWLIIWLRLKLSQTLRHIKGLPFTITSDRLFTGHTRDNSKGFRSCSIWRFAKFRQNALKVNIPASSWPALSVCARRSSGPSCSPPGWWAHWDRSVSPRASTSLGCFLSQGGRGEEEEKQWAKMPEKDGGVEGKGGREGWAGSTESRCRTFLMMDCSADSLRQRCF